jgi:hypothetical protein
MSGRRLLNWGSGGVDWVTSENALVESAYPEFYHLLFLQLGL